MPNLANYPNPTEDIECEAFHKWLEAKHIPHHHIANESRSGRYGMIRGAKLKRMGQSRGFPDYLVIIPAQRVFDRECRYCVIHHAEYGGQNVTAEIFSYRLVFIEMKRKKGGVVSPEQKQWLNVLNLAGIESVVCRGADEAIRFVEERL